MSFEVKGLKCLKCGKKTLTHEMRRENWMELCYTEATCRKCGAKFKEEDFK